MTQPLSLFRGGISEKGGIIAIKGGVVSKTAFCEHDSGSLALSDELVRQKQSLFQDIFFWRLMELA